MEEDGAVVQVQHVGFCVWAGGGWEVCGGLGAHSSRLGIAPALSYRVRDWDRDWDLVGNSPCEVPSSQRGAGHVWVCIKEASSSPPPRGFHVQ